MKKNKDYLLYAQIVDGVLQVTPDIEEDIDVAERGGTISLDEFKTLFAPWIEKSSSALIIRSSSRKPLSIYQKA